MDGTWNVYFGDKPIGTCRLVRQGLYWQVSCRCAASIDGICRLRLQCGDEAADLGVLVPMNGAFGLDRTIPVKNLPQGQPRFAVIPQDPRPEEEFIPVGEGEEFPYLSRLPEARFARRGSRTGIVLTHCETVNRE